MTLEDVAIALRGYRFRYANEDALQRGLAGALEASGFDVQREVILDAHSRIDLLIGGVGIEVKVAGSTPRVLRQLERYTRFDAVESLILVTSRARHAGDRRELGGKPFEVVSLHLAGL